MDRRYYKRIRDLKRHPIDAIDRERLIYQNGQYYRIKEQFWGGSPYVVPSYFYDPLSPWRFRSPSPWPIHYYEDLDLKYNQLIHQKMKLYHTHYNTAYDEDASNGIPSTSPIGCEATIRQVADITIAFADENLNYKVSMQQGDIYRVDYVEAAQLLSCIGKLSDIKFGKGYDYRGESISYCILYLDCSTEFGSDVKVIDSRGIRYIKSLTDLDTSMSIMRTYVGPQEPTDMSYGAWFNTDNGKLYRYNRETNTWVAVPDKPTEEPAEGYYWSYDAETNEWSQKEIPPAPLDNDLPNTNYEYRFSQAEGIWYIAPKKPREMPREGTRWVYDPEVNDYYEKDIADMPTNDPGEGKVWVYDESTDTWTAQNIPPYPTEDPGPGKTWRYNEDKNEYEIIMAEPEQPYNGEETIPKDVNGDPVTTNPDGDGTVVIEQGLNDHGSVITDTDTTITDNSETSHEMNVDDVNQQNHEPVNTLPEDNTSTEENTNTEPSTDNTETTNP